MVSSVTMTSGVIPERVFTRVGGGASAGEPRLLASLRVKDWVLAKLGAGVGRRYRLAYVIFATATTLPIRPLLFPGVVSVAGQTLDGWHIAGARFIYCYVQHPLYLFAILFVWLTLAMTANLSMIRVSGLR